jgi:hypothetical protein
MAAEDVKDDKGLHQQQDDVHFGPEGTRHGNRNPITRLAKASATLAAVSAAAAFAPAGAAAGAAAGGAALILNFLNRALPREKNVPRSSRKIAAAKEENVSSLLLELHNKLAEIVGVEKLTQQPIEDFTVKDLQTLQLLQEAITKIASDEEHRP